jgi:hypothetical protein
MLNSTFVFKKSAQGLAMQYFVAPLDYLTNHRVRGAHALQEPRTVGPPFDRGERSS